MNIVTIPKEFKSFCRLLVIEGTCLTNNCKFSHNKDDAPICKLWQKGTCIEVRGNNCPFRHYFNERDGSLAQSERFQDSGVSKENVDFSSPYTVKVRKEVESQRMEEVNLDTGRRRSRVATKDTKDMENAAGAKRKADSPLPGKGKEWSGIKSGAIRIPLTDITVVSVTEEEDTSDGPATTQPLSAAEGSLSNKECPVCHRTFKSAKGVTSHRSSKNSKCKIRKSPKGADKSNSTSGSVRSIQDDSVILIEDTPPSAGPRSSVRRSLRA